MSVENITTKNLKLVDLDCSNIVTGEIADLDIKEDTSQIADTSVKKN